VNATVEGLPAETFTLTSRGYKMPHDYLPPQIFIRHLTKVNDQGEVINAVKAGKPLPDPLQAAMFMTWSDYRLEGPRDCTRIDADGNTETYDCWDLVGEDLIKTRRITDGDVIFTPTAGDGVVADTENLGDGRYQAGYTTGTVPALNTLEAVAEARVQVPVVTGMLIGDNFYEVKQHRLESGTLQTTNATLKSGQFALFDSEGQLLNSRVTPISYNVYGVDVPTEVSPDYIMLGDGGLARQDVTVDYTIQPQGEGPAGYAAQSTQLDLFAGNCEKPDDNKDEWVGYLVGDATRGTGKAVYSRGSVFDPKRQYCVQIVLNRGPSAEIRGDKVKLQTLYADLDIDSDNNAGWQEDGTQNPPSRNPLEDQAEDLAGLPGKVMRPNLLDTDGDKVPGYADGIDVNEQEGDGASVPFYPLLFSIDGSIVDQATATVSFRYAGSDPAGVEKVEAEDGTVSYTTPPGTLRLWAKDGQFSRKVANLADGGDYVTPDTLYPLSLFNSNKTLYVEGIREITNAEEKKITLKVDPDGPGPLPEFDGDLVFATPVFAALVPDYDHNRVIDEKDRQRAALGDTYYFWINDDDDEGETEGNDTPIDNNILPRDYSNEYVDGIRDLIDFFPVAFELKEMTKAFPPSQFKYLLRAEDEQVNLLFPNQIVPNLKVSIVENYLIDIETAKQFTELYQEQIKTVKADGHFKTSFSEQFAKTFQQRLDEIVEQSASNEDQPVLLFEGNKKSSKPLVLEILNESGQPVFSTSLNLSLDGVEQMFRHKNLIKELRNFYPNHALPEHEPVPDEGMPDRLVIEDFSNQEHFAGFDAESDERNFVHVHGYNVNGQNARGEQAEIFKRLYWSGSRAKFWAITWYGWESQDPAYLKLLPCSGTRTPNYHVNVRHAINTGRLLKDFVNNNVQGNTTIFAHSLGNMAVSSAIHEGMNISRYLMVNSAVAEEAFTPEDVYSDGEAWESATKFSMYHPAWRYPDGFDGPIEWGYQPFLWASEWYKRFNNMPGDGRATLTWRNIFEEVRNKETYVYYTPTDEAFRPFNYSLDKVDSGSYPDNRTDWPGVEDVLQNYSCFNNSKIGTYSWAIQELFKGRFLIDSDSNTGGWGFNLDDDDYWKYPDPVSSKRVPISPYIANDIRMEQLKARPFFSINPEHSELYSDQPVSVSNLLREELLANEIPALTFAAGHRGIEEISSEPGKNIDIRLNYAIGKPWPEDRLNGYEWRHSDVYAIAYPFLFNLYDEWVNKINGGI